MNKQQKQYAYPLCIQLTLGQSIYDEEFISLLKLLHVHGFYGVELNSIDFENLPPMELKTLLDKYDLRLTMVASGACANAAECRTIALWQGLDRLISDYLSGVTVGDLMRRESPGDSYVI